MRVRYTVRPVTQRTLDQKVMGLQVEPLGCLWILATLEKSPESKYGQQCCCYVNVLDRFLFTSLYYLPHVVEHFSIGHILCHFSIRHILFHFSIRHILCHFSIGNILCIFYIRHILCHFGLLGCIANMSLKCWLVFNRIHYTT